MYVWRKGECPNPCDESDFPEGGTNCKFDFEVEDETWMDHSA